MRKVKWNMSSSHLTHPRRDQYSYAAQSQKATWSSGCDADTDDPERLARDSEHLMVREINHFVYFDQMNVEGAQKALRIPGMY